MRILGINCYGHDSAAALFEDGRVLAAASEERFMRLKKTGVFPRNAIKFCLACSKLTINQIDYFGYFYNPFICLPRRIFNLVKHFPHSFKEIEAECALEIMILRLKQKMRYFAPNNSLPKKVIKLFFVEHHLAHAASAFYTSEYEKAAILSIDGKGEACTALFASGRENRISVLKRVFFPHSLGLLYAAVTEYLGFIPEEDEYKVMGLASYGKPRYYNEFRDIVNILPDGRFIVDTNYFEFQNGFFQPSLVSNKFIKLFGPKRKDNEEASSHHADIAASLQARLEEVVLSMARYLYNVTKSPNLCLAGGVALNCAMNGRLLRDGPFKNIFVQPAASDNGTSLGAALYLYHCLLGKPRSYVMKSVFLGPEYSDSHIEQVLSANKLRHKYHSNIEEVVARLLSQGHIVGWFQGRMEFGPRALGARSILADPRNPKMKDIVNEKIKHREQFRPFAPSVLEESAADYFEGCAKSPFMTFVYPVKKDKINLIPAVTHVDNTARVQTVGRDDNPKYHKLIKEFGKITGIPVVLNTSFNVKGEPIVCSPEDAIRCFYSTGLDYLAIGDYLVEK